MRYGIRKPADRTDDPERHGRSVTPARPAPVQQAATPASRHDISAVPIGAVVQRKTAPGTRGQVYGAPNRTGLPDRLKAGVEAMSGVDMAPVRVHRNSAKPAHVNAHAYAHGNEIHIAPGQERHLPHEAWHVAQQAQGRAKPTSRLDHGVAVNDDAGLEREADIMGAKALSHPDEPERVSHPRAGNGMPPNETRPKVLQRYLIVNGTDYTEFYKANALTGDQLNRMIADIFLEMHKSLDMSNPGDSRIWSRMTSSPEIDGQLRLQLEKWIKDDAGNKTSLKSHKIFGAKQQTRVYADYKDLARALLGWVEAKPSRHDEKELAEQIENNTAADYHIGSVLLNIKSKIDNHTGNVSSIRRKDIRNYLKNPTTELATTGGPKSWSTYKTYFDSHHQGPETELPDDFLKVLSKPDKYDLREKTGVLHDVMQLFYELQLDSQVTGFIDDDKVDDMKATVLDSRGSAKRADYARPRNSRTDKIPPKPSEEESHPTYAYARRHKLPMYGRHSYTAARMISLAEQARSTKEQMTSVAWAIMSYWRLHYDHTSLPYHTQHEILDFLPNFGIDYDPLDAGENLKVLEDKGFKKTLKRDILSNKSPRDIDQLIALSGNYSAAKFFLDNESWTIPEIRNFLKTTVLPDNEFFRLSADSLYQFFISGKDTRQLFPMLPEDRQKHVLSGGPE